MDAPVSLTRVAGLIGDAARSDMLVALLAGRALTAGELSRLQESPRRTPAAICRNCWKADW